MLFGGSYFESQLIIPDSIVEIKEGAFGRIEGKENEDGEEIGIKIIMNDANGNLKSIGRRAFEDSELIGTLNLRSEISIADGAFSGTDVIVNRK